MQNETRFKFRRAGRNGHFVPMTWKQLPRAREMSSTKKKKKFLDHCIKDGSVLLTNAFIFSWKWISSKLKLYIDQKKILKNEFVSLQTKNDPHVSWIYARFWSIIFCYFFNAMIILWTIFFNFRNNFENLNNRFWPLMGRRNIRKTAFFETRIFIQNNVAFEFYCPFYFPFWSRPKSYRNSPGADVIVKKIFSPKNGLFDLNYCCLGRQKQS
jgi:hypothetical protein